METARQKPTTTAMAGAIALMLATGAAASLTVADLLNLHTSADELVSLGFLLGWTLIVWAAIAAAGVAAHLARGLARRRPTGVEILLIMATVAVLAGTILAYPLFGSGAASA